MQATESSPNWSSQKSSTDDVVSPVVGMSVDQDLDLLLVNSPLANYDERPRLNDYTLPCLGLGYLATFAADRGFNVGVLDAEALGMGLNEIAAQIERLQPRWVGLNLLAPTYQYSVRILQDLPRSARVMLGGHHAKAMPSEILADARIPRIDALVLGEAETRAAALLEDISVRRRLPGVTWRDGLGVHSGEELMSGRGGGWLAPDLDAMPLLDRRYLIAEPMRDVDGQLVAHMVGSRGCPYNCSFCGAAVSANRDVSIRARHPDNIVQEMEILLVAGVDRVRFVDDLFLARPKLIQQWIEAFRTSGIGDRLGWDATGRIDVVERLDDDTLDQLRTVGLREVALGVESASRRMLDRIDKRTTPEAAERSIQRLLGAGISVKGYYILGFPTETLAEAEETVAQIRRLSELADSMGRGSFRASVFEFRPYPGTPEWDRLVAAGFTPTELTAYEADARLTEAPELHARDEFNFSVNIQFYEYSTAQLRSMLREILGEQAARTRGQRAA